MFRVRVCGFDHIALESLEWVDQEQVAVQQAFEALLEREDLAGTKNLAVLTYGALHLVTHRFDREPGDVHQWSGRTDRISWPYPDMVVKPQMRRVIRADGYRRIGT